MARSVFYYHLKRLHRDKYEKEKSVISSVYHEHKGRYGYRRITIELRNRGIRLNHKTVQRLMGELGIKSNVRRVRYRSYKGEVGSIFPNRLGRDFHAEAPNRKWATDITQITIGQEKVYFSPILDMFNGEIVSYNISCRPDLQLVYGMLDKAFAKFDNLEGTILHTDQGWQYQHTGYCQRLAQKHIIQSMSRKGNCLDNAVIENFFGIMKTELLYAQKFQTTEDFITELKQYINYYNNKRIKLKLNGMSPINFRVSN